MYRKSVLVVSGCDEKKRLTRLLADAGFNIEEISSRADVTLDPTGYDCCVRVLTPEPPGKPVDEPSGLSKSDLFDALNSLAEQVTACLAYIDTNFNIIWVNNSCAQLLRRRPEETRGQKFPDLLACPDYGSILENVLAAQETWASVCEPLAFSGQREDDVTFWNTIVSPVKDDSGTIKGLVVLLADVTEYTRAEKALHQSEETSRAILKALPDLVFRVSGDGTILGVNKDTDPLLQDAPIKCLGKPIRSLLPRDVARVAMHKITKALQRQEVQTLNFDLNIDGVLRCYESRMVPAAKDEVLALVRNETHRRQAERELVRARKALEAAYHREHRIAEVLQHALVSEVMTTAPGCKIAARYQPALKEAEVGGDFYDVFRLANGGLALVIGDVSGKGLAAASHTAMAKYTCSGLMCMKIPNRRVCWRG